MELDPYTKGPEVLKAFLTAEGFGRNVMGGREGKVVIVASISDDGGGSFRWALQQCSQDEAITVVSAVLGKIELKSEICCRAKNLTLAEQTTPGGGVYIIKNEINFGGSENFIIRRVRFRVGEEDAGGKEHNAACLRMENANNFVIDHYSFNWASKENTGSVGTRFSTIQQCISSEGPYYPVNKKGARVYGGAWEGTSSAYHHNLLAYCNSRTPLMNGTRGKDLGQGIVVYMEHTSNVNYNWGSQVVIYRGMDESQDPEHHGQSCNFINDYYKPEPVTTTRVKELEFFQQSSAREPNKAPLRAAPKQYFHGDVMKGDSQLTSDSWEGVYTDGNYPYSIDGMKVSSLIIPSGKENYRQYWFGWESCTLSDQHEPAEETYQFMLADKSGAGVFLRDKVDARIIEEMKGGLYTHTGARDVNSGAIPGIINSPDEVEGLDGLTYKASGTIMDADQDGIDDAWERKVGLDPANPEDRNRTAEVDYTALEVYPNSLIDESIFYNFKKQNQC